MFNANANVKLNTFIFSTSGSFIPKLCPYDSQLSHSTCDATSPNKPPITNPANINSIAIHAFLPFLLFSSFVFFVLSSDTC